MRKFKDITEQELIAKIDEVLYYYLICDYVEADNETDKTFALTSMKDIFSKRDEVSKRVKETVYQNIKLNDKYETFEDVLFEAVEAELY